MSYCSQPARSGILYYLDENKFLTCITTFTFVVIAVFLYILTSYTFFEKRKIPRAVRPSAPFGNIKDVVFQNTTFYVFLWKYYNKFKRKGCKVGGFYLFFKPGILLVDPNLINKVLYEEDGYDDCCKRKTVRDYKKIVNIFKDEIVDNLLSHITNIQGTLFTNLKERADKFSTNLHDFLVKSTSLAFGVEDCSAVLSLINKTEGYMTSSTLRYYFNLVYPYFARSKSVKAWTNSVEDIIKKRKKTDVKKIDVVQSFIDLFNDNKSDSEEILIELFNIFIENIFHSYSLVLFCLYELSQNYDIQEELIGELRRFNKEHKSLNKDNLSELTYMEAVVKETLRKYPPVPFIMKKCNREYENTEFGLRLPKNTLMFITTFGIHHDPLNYSNPEDFDPDRFFEDNIKFIKPNTYIPFGFDAQKNIGFQFTTIHIKLALISIFSSFKVHWKNKKKSLEFDNMKINVHPKELSPLEFEFIL